MSNTIVQQRVVLSLGGCLPIAHKITDVQVDCAPVDEFGNPVVDANGFAIPTFTITQVSEQGEETQFIVELCPDKFMTVKDNGNNTLTAINVDGIEVTWCKELQIAPGYGIHFDGDSCDPTNPLTVNLDLCALDTLTAEQLAEANSVLTAGCVDGETVLFPNIDSTWMLSPVGPVNNTDGSITTCYDLVDRNNNNSVLTPNIYCHTSSPTPVATPDIVTNIEYREEGDVYINEEGDEYRVNPRTCCTKIDVLTTIYTGSEYAAFYEAPYERKFAKSTVEMHVSMQSAVRAQVDQDAEPNGFYWFNRYYGQLGGDVDRFGVNYFNSHETQQDNTVESVAHSDNMSGHFCQPVGIADLEVRIWRDWLDTPEYTSPATPAGSGPPIAVYTDRMYGLRIIIVETEVL